VPRTWALAGPCRTLIGIRSLRSLKGGATEGRKDIGHQVIGVFAEGSGEALFAKSTSPANRIRM
jgi:hypothetical protein